MKKISSLLIMCVFISVLYSQDKFIPPKPKESPFYVYKDAGARENHFIPSGWMGSFQSLKYNPNFKQGQKEGTSCIRIEYDVKKDSNTAWAGIYFQHPTNNWSGKIGGYDLTGFKKLSFWVKGTGIVEKFGIGGIASTEGEGDSDEAYIDRIELTEQWQKIEIPFKDLRLNHIIGGFYFAASAEYNNKNLVLFIDDIKYEK